MSSLFLTQFSKYNNNNTISNSYSAFPDTQRHLYVLLSRPAEKWKQFTHRFQVSTSFSCFPSCRWRWWTARLQTGPARTQTQSLTAGRPTSTWPTWGPSLGSCSKVKAVRIKTIHFRYLCSSPQQATEMCLLTITSCILTCPDVFVQDW